MFGKKTTSKPQLKVTIVGARVEPAHRAEIYVKLQLGDNQFRSSRKKLDNGISTVWFEEHLIPVQISPTAGLIVQLSDKSGVLGMGSLPLDQIKRNSIQTVGVKLHSHHEGFNGTITLMVQSFGNVGYDPVDKIQEIEHKQREAVEKEESEEMNALENTLIQRMEYFKEKLKEVSTVPLPNVTKTTIEEENEEEGLELINNICKVMKTRISKVLDNLKYNTSDFNQLESVIKMIDELKSSCSKEVQRLQKRISINDVERKFREEEIENKLKNLYKDNNKLNEQLSESSEKCRQLELQVQHFQHTFSRKDNISVDLSNPMTPVETSPTLSHSHYDGNIPTFSLNDTMLSLPSPSLSLNIPIQPLSPSSTSGRSTNSTRRQHNEEMANQLAEVRLRLERALDTKPG